MLLLEEIASEDPSYIHCVFLSIHPHI